MIAGLFAKLWGYLAAALAILVAIVIAIVYGREKGKASMQAKVDTAQSKADAATAIIHTVEARDATDQAIQNLPQPVAPSPVDSADPGSAADRLHTGGFTRD